MHVSKRWSGVRQGRHRPLRAASIKVGCLMTKLSRRQGNWRALRETIGDQTCVVCPTMTLPAKFGRRRAVVRLWPTRLGLVRAWQHRHLPTGYADWRPGFPARRSAARFRCRNSPARRSSGPGTRDSLLLVRCPRCSPLTETVPPSPRSGIRPCAFRRAPSGPPQLHRRGFRQVPI